MKENNFIKDLSQKTGFDEKKCIEINNIIEDTFIIGKKNKEKMISRFISELGFSENEANSVYETSMNILASRVKDKLKHPFKSQD